MTQTEKQNVINVLNNRQVLEHFLYLYERWQDEKEYEDFNDYAKSMMQSMPNGATLIKGTKRPFGVVINYGSNKVHISLKLRGNYASLTAKNLEK
jgi:hypothetical protein